MAESRKFDLIGPAIVCGLQAVDVLVTDAGIRRDKSNGLKSAGIEVVLAPPAAS
jgi:DeoR/GlpR family transcriptional regulator of sugar metabolism